jgi:hypothetical protein
MSVNAPFTVTGNTVVVTATSPAPAPTQVASLTFGWQPVSSHQCWYCSCFPRFWRRSATATAGANTPNGLVKNCLPLIARNRRNPDFCA